MKKTLISFLVIVAMFVIVIYLSVRKDESKEAKIVEVKKEILGNDLIGKESVKVDKIVKVGNFNKIDALHYASGYVEVSNQGGNYKIEFKDNFISADGPDLYVYLSSQENIRNIALASVDTSKTINLGLLKSINGVQSYLVSKEDFENYNKSIIVWCKQFRVQFSRADLK